MKALLFLSVIATSINHNSIHRAVRISIRLYRYRSLYHDRW